MSIRKIRKAGQKKVFMACAYWGNAFYAYTKQYGAQRFIRIKPKAKRD